jgi:hypothetical protein
VLLTETDKKGNTRSKGQFNLLSQGG